MKVLSLSLDLELSRLRSTILRSAGYDVTSLTSEKDAFREAESTNAYDVVLLCHHFPSASSRRLIRVARQKHPKTRFIHIVHVYGEWPEIEADRYIVGADGPDTLLRVLQEVLEPEVQK
jgi:CheY-like chemotaxis protein